MATHLMTPCSYSSSSSNCSIANDAKSMLINQFISSSGKSKWVSQIYARRKYFCLKSSNGHPYTSAVSPQDGVAEGHVTKDNESEGETRESTLSITVVGASGDLAKKKIFPALFALFYDDWLPQSFTVFGYARTKLTDEELRNMISKTLTCRIDQRENCEDKMDQFLKRCFYQSGQYNSEDHFSELDKKLREREAGKLSNRLLYLSIPPNIFVDVVRCVSTRASSTGGWTRVIVEKPFGRDTESSRELTTCLKQYLTETA